MRIKNEYIKIKNGNKTTTLQNYIYDNYLKPFSKTQYLSQYEDIRVEQPKKVMQQVYIKFDTNISDVKNATINDFEIYTIKNKINIETSNNTIKTTYDYYLTKANKISDLSVVDISDYYNRKITALGFGNNLTLYACLDVSNYNIYILENEDIYISRKDIITTESECVGYDYPVHLIPTGDIKNAIYNSATESYENLYAKLYSVGFAKAKGIIDEEYIIGQDIEVNVKSDTSFGFNLLKGENETIYPQEDRYTAEDMYPLPPYSRKEMFPSNNLYPKENLYPKDSNFKFICYKYRLYTIHWYGISSQSGYFDIQYLNEYYTTYLKNNTTGYFEIVTKIERSDD